jgi:hypothetical protein
MRNYRVPVILISGSLQPGDSHLVGHCLIDIISKPTSGESVLEIIRGALDLNLTIWFTQPSPLEIIVAPFSTKQELPFSRSQRT